MFSSTEHGEERKTTLKMKPHRVRKPLQVNVVALGYMLLWDGKMLQNIEAVGTSKEVIAIFLAATDKKSDVLLQINPVDQKYSTASERTKFIFDTLDKRKIERDLVIGLVFNTTSIKVGICSGVAVSLEQAFGTKLLLLVCQHHVLELLC